MARRITEEFGYHWCNDHEAHATDPLRHRHVWKYVTMDTNYAIFICPCTRVKKVYPKTEDELHNHGET